MQSILLSQTEIIFSLKDYTVGSNFPALLNHFSAEQVLIGYRITCRKYITEKIIANYWS